MLVREIKKSDNEIIASIIRSVMKEFDANPKTTILGDPTLDTMFQNYQTPRAVYYIIEEDNKVVGGCGIKQLDNSVENICELQRMFLLPTSRGKGFGRQLIELCIKRAKEFGYDEIYLETLGDMKKAQLLYLDLGFKRIDKSKGNTGHRGCDVYMALSV